MALQCGVALKIGKKQYESNNLIYQYHEEDQFFERNARCSNFIYC